MRKYRPTFNDTALARRPGGILVPLRVFTMMRIAFPVFVFAAVRIYTLMAPSWLSWSLAVLSVPVTVIAITATLIPSEVENRRVVDLAPDDLVVPSKEIGLFPAAFPVLSRSTILDASPQVEVVLAGRRDPIIYEPNDETMILEPIGVEPRLHSPEEDEVMHRVLSAAANLNDSWLSVATEEELRMARRLGLAENKPLQRGSRWSRSARSYAVAISTELNQSKQAVHNPDQATSVIVVVNGDLMLQIDGQDERVADLIDHLEEKVTQLADRAIVEQIRTAVDQKDKRGAARGIRELGQDTLVNALGGAAGNALWAAAAALTQGFW